VAFRPCLTAGLALSLIVTISQFVWENIITERASSVHFYRVINWDLDGSVRISIPSPEDERPARIPSPFTWQEREHFENIFKSYFTAHYPLVICGFRTGLRIGEMVGLKWADIDFHNRQVFVRRNATRGKITTPKSPSSKRLVRMTGQLVEVLQLHRKRCLEGVLKNGWKELPVWVFHNNQGGLINYDNFINRVWNKAVTKSGLSRRTPHDMRHTYATLRLSKGDSLAEVSKEMGHRSPDITYKTYYKWLPKESRSNIDELDGHWEEDATIRNLSATK
jgi:integrase